MNGWFAMKVWCCGCVQVYLVLLLYEKTSEQADWQKKEKKSRRRSTVNEEVTKEMM
jgi:hypothetical protein